MKKTLSIAAVAAAALALTSLAVAKGLDSNTNVRGLAGTFNATTASKVETRTCTTTDGKTLVKSTGTYTGAAAGDADLAGNVTIRATSTINSTDNVGVIGGTVKIDVASGRDTQAHFDGVYANGQIAGLAGGRAHSPYARLIANISAGYTASGGFTDGKIGGSAGGGAVEVGPGRCKPSKVVRQHSEARGTISAVSTTSITVAGLTCAVPAGLQARVAKLQVNQRAEIKCSLVNGTNTLTRVEARR
jgi:hypothetical protein